MSKEVLRQAWRLLTFREARIDLGRLKFAYLSFAIVATWLAGVGRYWDHPSADWWQYAGLGSLAYIGLLSIFLWLVVWPLRPRRWSFLAVFVFVGLTAPPAWLYAIPVERFMPMAWAALTNMWFLLVVATWRVVLYALFLKRFAGLSGLSVFVATLLPLVVIVTALAALNLEQAVFQIMGGLDREPTAADQAYEVVFLLSVLSFLAAPVLLACYLFACFKAHERHKARA